MTEREARLHAQKQGLAVTLFSALRCEGVSECSGGGVCKAERGVETLPSINTQPRYTVPSILGKQGGGFRREGTREERLRKEERERGSEREREGK